MECDFCEIFNTATIRTKHDRYCPVVRRNVTRQTEKCGRFIAYHNIWCPKNGYQLAVVCCLNRQQKEYEECYRCSHGKKVMNISRLRTRKLTTKVEYGDTKVIPPKIEEHKRRRLSRISSI